ncbi:hypothetical protein NMG60_11005826 [Bertholletia excelsa]
MNDEELNNKFSKYEADYTRRLMAKYFSDKDIYGGDIFDESIMLDGDTIKASRWHCAQSFADPVQFLKDKGGSSSPSLSDTPSGISNGKHTIKKDG